MSYKVIKTSTTEDGLLKHFLGKTPEEALDTYNEYSGLLHSVATSYHLTTNLDIEDLFETALTGLAIAKRDFNPKRSNNFKTYAYFRIKDELNKYIRENTAPVIIPSYIKKAYALIQKLKHRLGKNQFRQMVNTVTVHDDYINLLNNLVKAADRCGLTLKELVERAENLPLGEEYKDGHSKTDESSIFSEILVSELKSQMTDDELFVAEGIMNDKTHTRIAEEKGKSKTWVSNVVKQMRIKFKNS